MGYIVEIREMRLRGSPRPGKGTRLEPIFRSLFWKAPCDVPLQTLFSIGTK